MFKWENLIIDSLKLLYLIIPMIMSNLKNIDGDIKCNWII